MNLLRLLQTVWSVSRVLLCYPVIFQILMIIPAVFTSFFDVLTFTASSSLGFVQPFCSPLKHYTLLMDHKQFPQTCFSASTMVLRSFSLGPYTFLTSTLAKVTERHFIAAYSFHGNDFHVPIWPITL